MDPATFGTAPRWAGRRVGASLEVGRRGRCVGARPLAPSEPPVDLAWAATLGAAARRRADQGEGREAALRLTRCDWRRRLRRRPREGLIVLLLDSSDSMGCEARMATAKGAALALLSHAYLGRDRTCLVTFEGRGAAVVLPPTRSVALARERLQALPTGGATPLAAGLVCALGVVRNERLKRAASAPVLVLLTDGCANVPLRAGADLASEVRALGARLQAAGVRSVVVAPQSGQTTAGPLAELARWLGAEQLPIARWQAGALVAGLVR